jgi:cephalosporin-C deacetylase-like acetyl esterase
MEVDVDRRPIGAVCRTILVLATLGVAAVAGAGAQAAPSAIDLTPAVGAYRLPDGSVASVFEQDGQFRFLDYATGEFRNLHPQSAGVFVGGPGVAVADPVSLTVAPGPLAKGRASWIAVNGVRATRIALVSQRASFVNGGVRLAGRLMTPATTPGRRLPAVVIVPANRGSSDLWALFFASHGYAVLTYERRGVRRSGGTYDHDATDPNMRLLAQDALAGVTWLRHRPEIDPSRIGLSGGSQAGWVIEVAAAASAQLRFVAMQSSPAMSAARQAAYSTLTGYGRRAPSDEQIASTLASVPDSGFDPKPYLAAIKVPMLWQLGSVDKRMYTPETVADLAAATAQSGNAFTVKVYAGGAHSLRLTTNGLTSEEQQSPGFVPGLFTDLAAWLQANG